MSTRLDPDMTCLVTGSGSVYITDSSVYITGHKLGPDTHFVNIRDVLSLGMLKGWGRPKGPQTLPEKSLNLIYQKCIEIKVLL